MIQWIIQKTKNVFSEFWTDLRSRNDLRVERIHYSDEREDFVITIDAACQSFFSSRFSLSEIEDNPTLCEEFSAQTNQLFGYLKAVLDLAPKYSLEKLHFDSENAACMSIKAHLKN